MELVKAGVWNRLGWKGGSWRSSGGMCWCSAGRKEWSKGWSGEWGGSCGSAGWEDGCRLGPSMLCHELKEGTGDSDYIDWLWDYRVKEWLGGGSGWFKMWTLRYKDLYLGFLYRASAFWLRWCLARSLRSGTGPLEGRPNSTQSQISSGFLRRALRSLEYRHLEVWGGWCGMRLIK